MFAQSRHRLSSSYDFSAPAQPLASFTPCEPQYSEPPSHSYHLDSDAYLYFDPWDEFVDQVDNVAPQESYQNFNSSLDNYVDTDGDCEVNYGDHHTQFSDHHPQFSDHHPQFSDQDVNNDHKDSSIVHHTIPSSNLVSNYDSDIFRSNYSDCLPSVDVSTESLHSYVPVNGGGGDTNLWGRPSRQDSFSQPVRSISAPALTLPERTPESSLPENHIVVETHAPPPCEPSSVVSHPDEQVTYSPPPEPNAGLAGALATVKLGAPLSAEQAALEEHLRRQGWEQGNIDYMGKDSFSNIWQKICETLSGTKITPVESPAPVAPVAAPTYISSVEISPSGPIDTSPPASYAPVSSITPIATVGSDTKAVSLEAASAETTAVVTETKSPSVAELVSTPSIPDSSDKTTTPSEDSSHTLIPLTSTAPVSSVIADSATTVPLASADTLAPKLQTSVPEEKPTTTSPPKDQSSTTTAVKTQPQVVAPQPDLIKPTEGPAPLQSIQASIPLPVTPTDTVVQTPVPSTQSETMIQKPIPLPSSPTTKIPEPVPAVSTDTPVQSPIPPPATPTSISVPVTSAESLVSSTPLPTAPPAPQITPPESPQSPKDSAPPTTVKTADLPLTPISTPSSPQSPPTGTQTPAQPQTPTVTGPTPPTSPPIGAVESPLTTKLKVETETPATPPVGGSSTQPALTSAPSDEPPVPPKRKGGSKAQDTKGQKGKPSKGKK